MRNKQSGNLMMMMIFVEMCSMRNVHGNDGCFDGTLLGVSGVWLPFGCVFHVSVVCDRNLKQSFTDHNKQFSFRV